MLKAYFAHSNFSIQFSRVLFFPRELMLILVKRDIFASESDKRVSFRSMEQGKRVVGELC